jgi:hypothetical protein
VDDFIANYMSGILLNVTHTYPPSKGNYVSEQQQAGPG